MAYLVGAGPLALALLCYFALATPARTDAGGEHIWGPLKAAMAAPLSTTHGFPQLAFQVGYLSIFMLEAAALALAPVAIVLAGQLRAVVPPTGAGRRFVLGAMALSALTLVAIGVLRLAGAAAPWWPLGEAVGVPLLPLDALGLPGSRLAVWVAVVLLADVSLVVLLGALAAGARRARDAGPGGAAGRRPLRQRGGDGPGGLHLLALRHRPAGAPGDGRGLRHPAPPGAPRSSLAADRPVAGRSLAAGLSSTAVSSHHRCPLVGRPEACRPPGSRSRDIHAGYEYLGTARRPERAGPDDAAGGALRPRW